MSGVITAALLIGAEPSAAQAPDASVAPRGVVRFDVGGRFAHFDVRRVDGATEPASAWYAARVGELTGELGRVAGSELGRFFAGTGGVPADGLGEASLGEADVGYQGTTRQVPMRLAIGLLPRLELTVSLPLDRDEVLVQRFWLEGGTLGLNPDPVRNAALLGSIDAQWVEIGGSPLLPARGTPLGTQLAERVFALTGEEISLPDAAANAELLAALLAATPGLAPPLTGVRPWRAGDVEIGGRLRVLDTFGGRTYPAPDGGLDFRLTVGAAARLPSGQEVEPVEPFTQLPTVGHSGYRAGVDADLFLGRRFWISAGSSYLSVDGREEETPGSPLVEAVIWSPGTELGSHVAPRYRLTEAISLGARYEAITSGEARREVRGEEGTFALVTPAGTVQRAGVELRYSTVATLDAIPGRLRGPLAIEFGLGYLRTFAAPEGTPLPRLVVLQGSVMHRMW